MIDITISVDDINSVILVFDKTQLMRYTGTGIPPAIVDESMYTTLSGIDKINSREGVSDINLSSTYSQYYFTDPSGLGTDYYISRYFHSATSAASAWSSPILGETSDIFYNPMYPVEIAYGSSDRLVIGRIRRLIGDPIGLRRAHGEEEEYNLSSDRKVYQLDESGWPASINMYGTQYTSSNNPVVNGYEYLKFTNSITDIYTVTSGIEYSVDIWYYTFRNSDRQIMEAYDNCPPPPPLSSLNCTSEIFMLSTAYDLLSSEAWENINEDGAKIADEGSSYDPSAGLRARDAMLAKLKFPKYKFNTFKGM
jgi:hypothetical protein